MSTYHEAADAIRRAAKQYEVFVKAAEILESTGSFENAAKEADAARLKAAAARDAALAELAQAKTDLAAAKAQAKKIADESLEAYDAAMADARIKGANEAHEMKEKAKADAEKIMAAAHAKAVKAAAEAQANEERASQLATEVKELAAECHALVTDRDRLQGAIDSLKAKFA